MPSLINCPVSNSQKMGETGHDKNYWRIRTIPRSTDNVHLQNLAVHFLCYLFLDNSQFVSYYLWFRNYFYPKVLSRFFKKSILCMFYSVICVHQFVAFTYKWQVIWRILCHIFFLHYHVLFHSLYLSRLHARSQR